MKMRIKKNPSSSNSVPHYGIPFRLDPQVFQVNTEESLKPHRAFRFARLGDLRAKRLQRPKAFQAIQSVGQLFIPHPRRDLANISRAGFARRVIVLEIETGKVNKRLKPVRQSPSKFLLPTEKPHKRFKRRKIPTSAALIERFSVKKLAGAIGQTGLAISPTKPPSKP